MFVALKMSEIMKNVFCDIKTQFLPHRDTLHLHYRVQPVNAISFEIFTAATMKNVVQGYKNPVRTSQETHYVSVTESSQLMLCKI
jgi:hypothetical protein